MSSELARCIIPTTIIWSQFSSVEVPGGVKGGGGGGGRGEEQAERTESIGGLGKRMVSAR